MLLSKNEIIDRLSEKKYLIGAVMFLNSSKDVKLDNYSRKIFQKCLDEFRNNQEISTDTERIVQLILNRFYTILSKGWRPIFIRRQSKIEDIKTAKYLGKTLYLKFQFSDKNKFESCLNFVKSLKGARWVKTKGSWAIQLNFETIIKVREYGFELSEGLEQLCEKYDRDSRVDRIKKINPNGLKIEPFEYQKEGIGWVEKCNGRAIIADQMGLGKSLQTIGYLTYHPELRPALIICPGFLKLNWEKEFKKFMPDTMTRSIQVLEGMPKKEAKIYGDIIIANYEILSNSYSKKTKQIKRYGWEHYLCNTGLKFISMDEFHYIKNPSALRTKATLNICRGVDKIVPLSGTPMTSRPIDMFPVLNLIAPELFPSLYNFQQTFCAPRFNGFGWEFKGSSNEKELGDLLYRIMIRRNKSEVLKDLPPITKTVIPIDIKNRSEYNKAKNNFVDWFMKNKPDADQKKVKKNQHVIKLDALKQLAVKGKLDTAIEWIQNFIDQEKLVVFLDHREVAEILMNKFKKVAVEVTGRVSSTKKKNEAVERFQNNDNCRLFIGSRAALEGLTLTKASTLLFLEFYWNPGQVEQALSRIHRIGQTANHVDIIFMVGNKTIEHDIVKIIDKKTDMMSKVLEGESASGNSLLNEILKKYS